MLGSYRTPSVYLRGKCKVKLLFISLVYTHQPASIAVSLDKMEENLLSDEVRHLLIIENGTSPKCVDFTASDKLFDWKKIEAYFGEAIVPHDQPLPYEFCKRLTPKFHNFLKSCPKPSTYSSSSSNFEWTNRSELIDLIRAPETDNLTSLLVLTSILEYALGNIYLTETGSVPPHLLRDLLATEALVRVLGETPIYLLRVLLGTPNGINLRNLVWHGFPREEQTSPLYKNFLMLILSDIGDMLSRGSYEIKHRRCPQDTPQIFRSMKLNQFDVRLLEDCLTSRGQTDGWSQTLKYYWGGQFYLCVCLALPQLEMFLRKLYGQQYQRDYRAKIDEYYIIMDTIFEEYSDDGARNKMHDCISRSLLELVYDVLSAVTGPRIRDKLGHGELQLDQIDESVANRVLLICYLLIVNPDDYDYRSMFHPNAILRTNLKECQTVVHGCQQIEFPSDLTPTWNSTDPVSFIPNVPIPTNVPIFYRPQCEEELIGLLQRISVVLKRAALNLNESLTARLEALQKRELRSRARNTLVNMIKMLPIIWAGLELVTLLVTWIFHCLMESDGQLRDTAKVVRFLKFILKYMENAANNLSPKSNAWLPLYETTQRELYDKTRQNLTLLLC